jgi:hypothetical protein
MQLNQDVEDWAQHTGKLIMYDKGASSKSALPFARLYGYAVMADLSPTVMRIYSSSSRQKALIALWDSGQREGLRVRPAEGSKHIREENGQPASDAIDMPCSNVLNDSKCATIARELGLRAGSDFRVSDPGHYDLP